MDLGIAGRRALVCASSRGLGRAGAEDVARHNLTLNNLLPERFDTDRQRYMAERDMQRHGISMEEARQRIAQSIAAGRMGRPKEFGATCAFVCSAHAGYMSGMNVHLDGGSYPGLI
jgi:3-oxoacyl-[acyl-carrier protein] reductase